MLLTVASEEPVPQVSVPVLCVDIEYVWEMLGLHKIHQVCSLQASSHGIGYK